MISKEEEEQQQSDSYDRHVLLRGKKTTNSRDVIFSDPLHLTECFQGPAIQLTALDS